MAGIAQDGLTWGFIFLCVYLLVRPLPVIGTVARLSLRSAWVFAPLVIVAGGAAFIWYEGRALIMGEPAATPVVIAEPEPKAVASVPLPPERPRD